MKFEYTRVMNLEGAFRGMRNPMDSWDKSDSSYCEFEGECSDLCLANCPLNISECYCICENDMKLARSLVKGGSEHRKFMRQIMVSVDITAPRYWWSEFDTYYVGVTKNSCSTMHKLKSYPITLDMFAIDDNATEDAYLNIMIAHLEGLRQKYNETKDMKWFRLLKQELPESFLQKRTITLNYENLFSMVHQRDHHRLTEWSVDFINWVKSLPYTEELIFSE